MRRFWLAFFVLFTVCFTPQTAAAYASPDAAGCAAQTDIDIGYKEISTKPELRDCGENRWDISGPRSWAFFSAGDAEFKDQKFLIVEMRAFSRIAVHVTDADGKVRSQSWSTDEAGQFWQVGSKLHLPVPATGNPVSEIAVAVDYPFSPLMLTHARIGGQADTQNNITLVLLVAIFIGLAMAPLIYNSAFYRILHEPFLRWYQLVIVASLVNIATRTSLIFYFWESIPLSIAMLMSPISFSIGVAAGAMFAASFIEKDKLSPRLRKLMKYTAAWIIVTGLIGIYPIEAMRPYAFQFYHLCYVPVVFIFAYVIAAAIRNGSRAARFQLCAWLPIVAIGLERVVRSIIGYEIPDPFDNLLFVALSLDITIMALGVADRLMILRRERDQAEDEIRKLLDIAETDPLTSILNRRGIASHFRQIESKITGIALLDLDHFKHVNDEYGHEMGDRVLQSVATALESSSASVAARMGGEEFLLLLTARNARQEAERLRLAITRQVARDVTGLQNPVTASCGLCHVDPWDGKSFVDLYAEADKLLYRAKEAGRNRIMTNDAPVRRVSLPMTMNRKNSAA